MPRFRGLSEAIRYHVKQLNTPLDIPPSSALSLDVGAQELTTFSGDVSPSVLRWGFSTWGIERVINKYKPTDL